MRFSSTSSIISLAVLAVFAAEAPESAAQRPVFGQSDSITVAPLRLGFDAEVGLGLFENAVGENERYFSSLFMPSLAKGKWEAGLLLKFRLNGGGFRTEDYDEVRDWLTILRYVQYATKGDSGYYGRIGDLEEARIGYGQVVNDYRNTVSLDRPRLGFEFDIDAGKLLMESFVSDLSGIGVYGVRGAVRPFLDEKATRWQEAALGLSVAGDLARESRFVNPASPGVAYLLDDRVQAIDSLGVVPAELKSRALFLSADIGIPIRVRQAQHLLGYAAVSHMVGSGFGVSFGVEARRDLPGRRLEIWLEQRVSGPDYIPSYFNSLYEVERIRDFGVSLPDGTTLDAATGKRNLIETRDGLELGSYVAFAYRYKRLVRFKTSYEHAWNRHHSGWFHLDVDLRHPDLLYTLKVAYDVINVDQVEDVTRGPSEDSLVRLAFAYRFWEHLLIGVDLRQSFEPRESRGRIVGQSKRTRLLPGFVLRI